MSKLQELENKLIEIQKEIEALKKEEQANNWVPEIRERYWQVYHDGSSAYSCHWDNDELDTSKLSIGNVFKTKEEAEFALERLKVIHELKQFSKPFKVNKLNHYFYYNCEDKKMIFDDDIIFKRPCLYFESEDIAKQAVETVGEDRTKKYYFGVVEDGAKV